MRMEITNNSRVAIYARVSSEQQAEADTISSQIEALKQRLQSGLVEEVQRLLDKGISHHQLERYGLEYRWISYFLRGEVAYLEMFQKLAVEIRRYSKRQMTFIRYLQKNGRLLIPITDSTDFLAGAMSWLTEEQPEAFYI